MPDQDKKQEGMMNAFKVVLSKLVKPSPEQKPKTMQAVADSLDRVDRSGKVIPRENK